jgi:glycosyltransferase involved in cell wall biosynthesis|tara:strand:- start:1613 stop:2836 length:1224 start_codon:yes stop_codon:yes gene_type:complete
MRLLFVVQRYGEDIAGGSEQCCRLFCEHLARNGHQVTVATSCAKSYTDWANEFEPGYETINNVAVKRFPVDRPRDAKRFTSVDASVVWESYPTPLATQELWVDEMGPRTIEMATWLESQVTKFDAMIFFTYLYYPTIRGLQAVAGKIPTLFQPTAHVEPHISVPLFDQLFRLPDGFAFLSKEEANLVNTRFGHRPVEDIVGVGTDLDLHGVGHRFRERHNLGNDPFLLYVGRIDPGKGSLEAFEYFAAYKKRNPSNLKFVVVGDSVMHLPDHPDVISTGFVAEQEKLDAIDACTIFLQPSYFESFSMALTEAWALRCAALVQGRCEVLSGHADRSGGALKYEGFAEFEAAVDLLLENQEIIDELGTNGRSYVEENYQWEHVIFRYEKLLKEVIKSFEEQRLQRSTGR